MRTGVAASVIAHAALLIVAIAGLGSARPYEPEIVESISVELVPVDSVSNIRAGALDSTIVETETPAVVEDVKPAELAQPTGNTEENQIKPEATDTATPAPTVNSAPEPVPDVQPLPEPDPVPVSEPTPPAEAQPVVEPAADPAPAVAEPDPVLAAPPAPEQPADTTPQPAARPATLDQARADFKTQKAAEKKKAAEAAKRTAQAKLEKDKAAKAADEVSAIINAEESRGATTGQGGTPTLGKPTGTSARLTQSETDALVASMRKCWNVPLGASDAAIQVRLMVDLNPDGTVAGPPRIVNSPATPLENTTALAAVRAVQKCAPYALAADKYEQWQQIDVTFDSRDAF